MTVYQSLEQACRRQAPDAALVLGSGLGDVARRVTPELVLPFADIPGLPTSSIAGHRGRLVLGTWAGKRVLLFEGRLHYYEGHSWDVVARPIHVAFELGARVLVLTNAAGGIGDGLDAGRLMVIRDQIELTRPWWWRIDQPSLYSSRLLEKLMVAATGVGFALPRGVYAAVTGPCYETPAEVRALRAWGADAVGMSTAHEARVAAELGLEVAAVSLITNRAAGLADGPLNHEEVLSNAAAAAGRMGELLEAFIGAM